MSDAKPKPPPEYRQSPTHWKPGLVERDAAAQRLAAARSAGGGYLGTVRIRPRYEDDPLPKAPQ